MSEEEGSEMQLTTITMDVAKRVFEVAGFDRRGERVVQRRLRRSQVVEFFERRKERCQVVLEACGSAHYWGRRLQAMGYRVALLPPRYVAGFRLGQKTDANDTLALYSAWCDLRVRERAVAVKSEAQQGWQGLQRYRSGCTQRLTALGNQLRAVLYEHGVVANRGWASLRRAVESELEAARLGVDVLTVLALGLEEVGELRRRRLEVDRRIRAWTGSDERCRRLCTIPGVGPLSAGALVAAVGDGRQFASGRKLVAWMGLCPREHSSGERRWLGKMTKAGPTELRRLWIQGARATLAATLKRAGQDPRSRWMRALVERVGMNKATVAVAAKNVRIACALLHQQLDYRAGTVDNAASA